MARVHSEKMTQGPGKPGPKKKQHKAHTGGRNARIIATLGRALIDLQQRKQGEADARDQPEEKAPPDPMDPSNNDTFGCQSRMAPAFKITRSHYASSSYLRLACLLMIIVVALSSPFVLGLSLGSVVCIATCGYMGVAFSKEYPYEWFGWSRTLESHRRIKCDPPPLVEINSLFDLAETLRDRRRLRNPEGVKAIHYVPIVSAILHYENDVRGLPIRGGKNYLIDHTITLYKVSSENGTAPAVVLNQVLFDIASTVCGKTRAEVSKSCEDSLRRMIPYNVPSDVKRAIQTGTALLIKALWECDRIDRADLAFLEDDYGHFR
jgi:hypothetical protein